LRRLAVLYSKFILLFSCCLCTSVKAVDLDPASHVYLSGKKYAKNIEVKGYLVTKDQLAKLFSEKNGEVIQKTNKDLHDKEVFLLIRCKNFGDYRAFSTLNCQLPNCGNPIPIRIMMMPGYMKFLRDTVMPIKGGLIRNDNKSPNITCQWKHLYTI
jgi:hypothetical protein